MSLDFGNDFPISDFYRPHIVDGETFSRSGGWWSAILLIKDPRSGKPFLGIYRWQHTDDGWKVRSSYKLRGGDQVAAAIDILGRFMPRVTELEK